MGESIDDMSEYDDNPSETRQAIKDMIVRLTDAVHSDESPLNQMDWDEMNECLGAIDQLELWCRVFKKNIKQKMREV